MTSSLPQCNTFNYFMHAIGLDINNMFLATVKHSYNYCIRVIGLDINDMLLSTVKHI